jgi:hypothetical protein
MNRCCQSFGVCAIGIENVDELLDMVPSNMFVDAVARNGFLSSKLKLRGEVLTFHDLVNETDCDHLFDFENTFCSLRDFELCCDRKNKKLFNNGCLILDWPSNNDVKFIKKFKPDYIFVIYDELGSAGSEDLRYWIKKCKGTKIQSAQYLPKKYKIHHKIKREIVTTEGEMCQIVAMLLSKPSIDANLGKSEKQYDSLLLQCNDSVYY